MAIRKIRKHNNYPDRTQRPVCGTLYTHLQGLLRDLLAQGRINTAEAAAIMGACEHVDSSPDSRFTIKYGTFAAEALQHLNSEFGLGPDGDGVDPPPGG